MQQPTIRTERTSVPSLPCPNCHENILATGFYNYCIESVGLREDNRTELSSGRLYMDHDEQGHETTDHECDVDAHCAECNACLPWPLYEIRALDGCAIAEAEQEIESLLAKLEDQSPNEPRTKDLLKGEAHAHA